MLGGVPEINPEPPLVSLWAAFRGDWKLIIFGSVLSLFLASVLMTGWPAGLWPNISYPYSYSVDSLFHAWMAQRVAEGWVFDNPRSGYPFGSNFLDFPGSDFGSHLIIKTLAMLSGDSFVSVNLFFLLGFSVVFASAFSVARVFGISRCFSFVGALLFAFLPFHFLRIVHLFYTWYFVVPLFFYWAFSIYSCRGDGFIDVNRGRWFNRVGVFFVLLVLSSFGVYYALFGIIIILLAGFLNLLRFKNFLGVKRALAISFVLVLGVLINVAPNLIGARENGVNTEVAQRSPVEAEIYGFKLIQLILPRADHRISSMGAFTNFYNSSFPLVNENYMSTLGVVASLGLLMTFLFLLASVVGVRMDSKISLLVAIVVVLFLVGTVGGLGAVFSSLISSSIRGWNRVSVFIAFASILIFFIAIQMLINNFAARFSVYSFVAALFVLVIGIYDQTVPACTACNFREKTTYESDRDFVRSIEQSLPEGGAVYQLPYMAFPETPVLNRLVNYDLAAGFLHSKALHWSFGGMKGRDGDMFYRSLAREPMDKQLEVLRRLGFNGIYIDRRGYVDNAQALVENLTKLLGVPPLLISSNGELVFFKLNSVESANLVGLSVGQIMEKSGYHVDHLGPRYFASLQEGIDFTRAGWPDFISNATGFSVIEPWGRWSDKNVSSNILLKFSSPLPQKFTLILTARAFASNANKPIKVMVGAREYSIELSSEVSEVRLDVDQKGGAVDSISFFPPAPISPGGGDMRKLGIGFVSLRLQF